ncbi:MAG: ABC transporter substrate-binding protein [Deltaproteobacteria bacterium]|nr:ABC transporter substrate-binding protein [Deltaproteobacteria bacterium]
MGRIRLSWLNTLAALGAVALAMAAGATLSREEPIARARHSDDRPRVRSAMAGEEVVDATLHVVPRRHYRRILSGNMFVDRLLLELCELERIVGVTELSARSRQMGFRLAGKARVRDIEDIEAILALRPDLVIMNRYGDPRQVARLREAGIEVMDLGEMRGLATLVPQVHAVAQVIGHPERGRDLADRFAWRMRRVAALVPEEARKKGMYVSVYGDRLYGGALGTSYHDVLVHAGLVDVAATTYRNWPEYSPEQLLSLDPEVLVTKPGMGSLLCRRPGLEKLTACTRERGVVEVDGDLLDDPGLAMLEATEEIYRALYDTPYNSTNPSAKYTWQSQASTPQP